MDYESLCRLVEETWNSTVNDIQWYKLKEKFKDRIASKRRLENTNSLFQLLQLLEKRDELNEDKVDCLKEIGLINNSNTLINQINEYEQHKQGNVSGSHVLLKRQIYDLICSNIGKNWKDFARWLNIPEAKLDSLEEKYRYNFNEKVIEIMKVYEASCGGNSQMWSSNLLNALEKARRKDLKIQVQELINNSK